MSYADFLEKLPELDKQMMKGYNEMFYKIIRGRNQIGGSITEVYDKDRRIFVDFGAELPTESEDSSDDQMIAMMKENPPDAVMFTHMHGDHIGLLYAIPDEVKKIFIGPVALKMMINIRETLLRMRDLEETVHTQLHKELDILNDGERIQVYEDGVSNQIGSIEFKPIRVDHSVFDAYMLCFKVDGKIILHTGDFRNHGRLGEGLIERIRNQIEHESVDILITEGTMMNRQSEQVLDEKKMQKIATKIMKKSKYTFLICSSTNMESLASFYWATVKSSEGGKKKPFIVNSYVKKQLELFTKEVGEKEDYWQFKFYRSYSIQEKLQYQLSNGKTQKQHMIDEGFTMLVGTGEYYRELMEQFRYLNPVVIYSMWDGYLKEGENYSNEELIALEKSWHEQFIHLHTSGHATAETIAEVMKVVNPREAIVPIHTENAKGFLELDIPEEMKRKVSFWNYFLKVFC